MVRSWLEIQLTRGDSQFYLDLKAALAALEPATSERYSKWKDN